QKDTRATAISIGAPLGITRADGADWAALNVARAWLGEHRMSQGRLFQRLRVHRVLQSSRRPVLPQPEHRPPLAGLRALDPPGRAGERAHVAAHRALR